MSDRTPTEPSIDELRGWAAALKHDLGKYVAWRSANLPEEAWTAAIDGLTIASLRADILATREAGGVAEPAWALFDRLVAPWPTPWPAELDAVAAAVAVLRRHGDALAAEDGVAIAAARPEIRAAQKTIRTALASLLRRLLEEV